MEDKIKEAIKLLTENGYIITKFTEKMDKDLNACESSDGTKDCSCCACSICVINGN